MNRRSTDYLCFDTGKWVSYAYLRLLQAIGARTRDFCIPVGEVSRAIRNYSEIPNGVHAIFMPLGIPERTCPSVLPLTRSVGDVRRWWDDPEANRYNGIHPRPRHHNLTPRRRGISELRPRADERRAKLTFANTHDTFDATFRVFRGEDNRARGPHRKPRKTARARTGRHVTNADHVTRSRCSRRWSRDIKNRNVGQIRPRSRLLVS